MKKFLFAMLAICAMAFTFISCENDLADEATYPVAGHQYYIEAAGQYMEFQFHKDFSVTLLIRKDGTTLTNDYIVWEMKNSKDLTLKGDSYSNVAGKVLYTGYYDAEKKSVFLTDAALNITLEYKQVGNN